MSSIHSGPHTQWWISMWIGSSNILSFPMMTVWKQNLHVSQSALIKLTLIQKAHSLLRPTVRHPPDPQEHLYLTTKIFPTSSGHSSNFHFRVTQVEPQFFPVLTQSLYHLIHTGWVAVTWEDMNIQLNDTPNTIDKTSQCIKDTHWGIMLAQDTLALILIQRFNYGVSHTM